MKKSVFIVACLIAISSFAMGQSYTQDNSLLNVGVGFGGSYFAGSMGIPPVSVSFEKGITEKISVGGSLGYASSEYKYAAYSWKYSYILVGARGSYHFYTTDKIDAYGGAMLGYNIVKAKSSVSSVNALAGSASSGLAYAGFVGARYYFKPTIGAFAELGYGISLLKAGIAFKF